MIASIMCATHKKVDIVANIESRKWLHLFVRSIENVDVFETDSLLPTFHTFCLDGYRGSHPTHDSGKKQHVNIFFPGV